MAAIASFVAGTFGVIALMLVAPPLARLSLAFSAPEYFALMVLGLTMVVLLSGESLTKGLLSMLLGLWIATMGTDLFTATSRFTFGQTALLGGIDFVIVAIGIFAIGEVLANMRVRHSIRHRIALRHDLPHLPHGRVGGSAQRVRCCHLGQRLLAEAMRDWL